MPITSPKLDAAQKQLDAAKASYQGYVTSYNNYGANITPCFDKDKTWYDASQASTWFNPDKSNCVGSVLKPQGCSNSDKNECQAFVDTLNQSIIPGLRAAYAQQTAAQANYDKVFDEVAAEAAADPAFILDQLEVEANAKAEALKQWFWIILLLLAAAATFIYFRWFRKKKQST